MDDVYRSDRLRLMAVERDLNRCQEALEEFWSTQNDHRTADATLLANTAWGALNAVLLLTRQAIKSLPKLETG